MLQFKTYMVTDQHQSVEYEDQSLDLVFRLQEHENDQWSKYHDLCVGSAEQTFDVECLIDRTLNDFKKVT